MDARIPSELAAALARARYMYVTTYSRAGKPGTVPTWLWPHDGDVYFTTLRDSLKARRIRNDGRVTVHVGTKDGPAFEGRAEWVDGRADRRCWSTSPRTDNARASRWRRERTWTRPDRPLRTRRRSHERQQLLRAVGGSGG